MTDPRIDPFSVHMDGTTLRGSVFRADAAYPGPRPVAVFFHGFGGTRVEASRMFIAQARQLTAAGITVVTYDRAGHGESDGDFFDTTVTGDIRTAHRVLEAVRALPGVDGDDLHLLGMSLGAVIASVVAAGQQPTRPVRSLTMWSTAAVFVDEIRSGRIQGMPLHTLDTLGWFDFHGMRMGPAMRADAVAFDPYGRAAGYEGPALLLHGTDDFVPHTYAERYATPEVFGDRAEVVVVEGADHGWEQLPQRDELHDRTTAFVTAHAG